MKRRNKLIGVVEAVNKRGQNGFSEHDEKGIYRCVLNLMTNAIDACDDSKGNVWISTEQKTDQQLEIIVSDDGCGIQKENLDNIFTVFFTTIRCKRDGPWPCSDPKNNSRTCGYYQSGTQSRERDLIYYYTSKDFKYCLIEKGGTILRALFFQLI